MSKLLAFPHPFFSERPTWKWFILTTVLIGATMSALDVSIVNVAMPTLKNDFNVSMATIEWVAIAYMLTLTIFLPLFGLLHSGVHLSGGSFSRLLPQTKSTPERIRIFTYPAIRW